MLTIEEYTEKLISAFKNKKNKAIFISVFLTGFISYFLLMIDGHTNPDGLIEGQYYYTNEKWALANGRWATRYLNLLIGSNIVIPLVVVILYCFCIFLSVIILAKIFRINKIVHLILTSAIMTASPSIIAQLPFTYMALCYAVAFLGAISYCYLIQNGGGVFHFYAG